MIWNVWRKNNEIFLLGRLTATFLEFQFFSNISINGDLLPLTFLTIMDLFSKFLFNKNHAPRSGRGEGMLWILYFYHSNYQP